MNEQGWSMLIGLGVVVGLRLLDWVFPKGYVWKRVSRWSVPRDEKQDGEDDERAQSDRI